MYVPRYGTLYLRCCYGLGLSVPQVRFALSSDEVFGSNSGRFFDIYAFYRSILKTLREEELADDVEVLRGRWNE